MQKRNDERTREEPSLPANQAFVVQFHAGTTGRPVESTGRVEHVVSGQAATFDSWEHLRRIVERMLAEMTTRPR
jgi:hypothetical protein